MKHWLIGAAAVALAVGPVGAQGNGHGKGGSGGHGNEGHGPAMNGPAMHGPSMHGPPMHGPPMRPAMQASVPQHGHGHGGGNGHADGHRVAETGMAAAKHPAGNGRPEMAREAKPPPQAELRGNPRSVRPKAANVPGPAIKVLQDGRHYYSARGARQTIDFAANRHGLIEGCPPGLAKKNNGCLPPGQAKQRVYRPEWWGLGGVANGPYAYDNGYLLRLNGDRVASYLPLLGGALSIGSIWPSAYAPLPVPQYYVDYYDLGPPNGYRYADNILYRVDPSTSAITSIAALLTGDTFQIGSPMPVGYDVYNVPYSYRSQYLDRPDAWYRYSDGYIYQVDPATRLITAAIDLLAGR